MVHERLSRSPHVRLAGFLLINVLLAVCHMLWPEYRWGQGRHSYFNFNNTITLASWLASMLTMIAGFAAIMIFNLQKLKLKESIVQRVPWLGIAMVFISWSILEFTRVLTRAHFFGLPSPNGYQQTFLLCLFALALIYTMYFLSSSLLRSRQARTYFISGAVLLVLMFCFKLFMTYSIFLSKPQVLWLDMLTGLSYLSAITFLTFSFCTYAYDLASKNIEQARTSWISAITNRHLMIIVPMMTFIIIFIQIVHFQILNIFTDHLRATEIISIALLGLSIGALIAWHQSKLNSLERDTEYVLLSCLLLPFEVLLSFVAIVELNRQPFWMSIFLMLPFISTSHVISIALIRAKSHLIYCVDLIGAACGALCVGVFLSYFREESTVLFLSAFAAAIAFSLMFYLKNRKIRLLAISLNFALIALFFIAGLSNLKLDFSNIVRYQAVKRMPQAEVLFSRSSFVGRYDVIRRKPSHKSLATYNNGRIIDNIRRRPPEMYAIDPRIPHTLMKDPVILILGLSGDGISKTARNLGKKVYGIEINPVTAALQQKELLPYNSNSYKDIDVTIMDGRSYVEQSNRQYDMITLMNAHTARGRTNGRAVSPEYLHTADAMKAYLKHLTDRGIVNIEEPVSNPAREVPVWKLVYTMKQALVSMGVESPEKHFFIFQWRTNRNNYIQILMKKTPFNNMDLKNLYKWLRDVDERKHLEKVAGKKLGPISTKTTILFSPDQPTESNYARILLGTAKETFLNAHGIEQTTDNKPFHFSVDPAHKPIMWVYLQTLLLALFILPFVFHLSRKYQKSVKPYIGIVGLTGIAYLLIEVVLIQKYQIFLGVPVISFTTVLGTLLVFSGLGSLVSGRLHIKEILIATLGLLFLVALQWLLMDKVILSLVGYGLYKKILLAIIMIAPLAFLMGIPFPYVLRLSQVNIHESTTSILFAINAAASAVAVPLALYCSSLYGFNRVYQLSFLIYLLVGGLLVSLQFQSKQRLAQIVALVVMISVLLFPLGRSYYQRNVVHANKETKIYALNYGKSYYPAYRIFANGDKTWQNFSWQFWLIQTPTRNILVDTGFNDKMLLSKWHFRYYRNPIQLLSELNLKPKGITDVIVTHGHWDHIGMIDQFNSAKIWIQEKEYQHIEKVFQFYTDIYRRGYNWYDYEALVKAKSEGRLQQLQGNHELTSKIKLIAGGEHTHGSQYVKVDTRDGIIFLAGDAFYHNDNNRWHIPNAQSVHLDNNLKAIKTMHQEMASPFLVIPGHDPEVMRWFPKVAQGIVEITTVRR